MLKALVAELPVTFACHVGPPDRSTRGWCATPSECAYKRPSWTTCVRIAEMCAWASRNAAGVVWTEWEPRTRSCLCGTAEPRTNSVSVRASNSTRLLDGSNAARSPCRNSPETDTVPDAMAVQRTVWLVGGL